MVNGTIAGAGQPGRARRVEIESMPSARLARISFIVDSASLSLVVSMDGPL